MNASPRPRPRFHREPFIDYQLFRAHALETLPLEAAHRGAARAGRPERIPAEFAALAVEAERAGRRPEAAVADRLGLQSFALVGLSMGGYWAVRAAAFEPRVAAVLSWSPVFDWTVRLPRPVGRLVRRAATWRGFMNASVRMRMRLFPVIRHVVVQANWMSHGSEPVDAVRWLLGMRAEHVSSERVRAPALLMVGERDRFQPPVLGDLQARALTNAEVMLRRFAAAEGAADHMQLGNLELATQVLTDWLQQRFGAEDRGPVARDPGTAP